MCGRRLRRFSASLVLSSLLLFSPFCSSCYADVVLMDEEAMELMNEIQESKKELNLVKSELSESKRESQELKTELQDVKNDYSEQKTYYEEQLNVAEKKTEHLKTAVTVTSTTSVVFCILMIVFIFV